MRYAIDAATLRHYADAEHYAAAITPLFSLMLAATLKDTPLTHATPLRHYLLLRHID